MSVVLLDVPYDVNRALKSSENKTKQKKQSIPCKALLVTVEELKEINELVLPRVPSTHAPRV